MLNSIAERVPFASGECIPDELKDLPQWAAWGYRVNGDGKAKKIAYRPGGGTADPDKPQLWTTYQRAEELFTASEGKYDGLAFIFSPTDRYAGIDLDKCCDDKQFIQPWAKQIIRIFNSYTEISPSGTGVKIWIKGRLSGTGRRSGPIELYSQGRYFTVTGRHLDNTPKTVEERQHLLNLLQTAMPIIAQRVVRGDSEQFQKLFYGDISSYNNNHSDADQALCNFAAHVGATAEQIDAVMRLSGLHRDKWERQDYRSQTINKALEGAKSQETNSTESTVGGGSKRTMAPLADPELNEIVTALRYGEITLSHESIRAVLRKAGEDIWTRMDINQRLHGSGIDVRAMWARLDAYECYSEAISMEEAMQLAQQEHTERLVENLLPCRGFSILAAKPKVGKSTLARNLIASVINGGTFLGRRVVQTGGVLYFVLEEEFSEVIGHLHDLGVSGDAPITFRRGSMLPMTFRRILEADIARYQPKLVIADPLIRLLGLEDVNDYGAVNAAIMPLVDIARKADAHFMALHHTNKMSAALDMDAMLGSTAFVGSVDVALLMGRKDDKRFIRSYKRYRGDIELPKTELIMDDSTGGVGVTSTQSTVKTEEDLPQLMASKLSSMGREMSRNGLVEACGVQKKKGLAAIKDGISQGLIIETRGRITAAQPMLPGTL